MSKVVSGTTLYFSYFFFCQNSDMKNLFQTIRNCPVVCPSKSPFSFRACRQLLILSTVAWNWREKKSFLSYSKVALEVFRRRRGKREGWKKKPAFYAGKAKQAKVHISVDYLTKPSSNFHVERDLQFFIFDPS